MAEFHKIAGKAGAISLKKKESIFRKKEEARVKYYASPKLCFYCQTLLSFEKRKSKFCNHSCAAQHNNFARGFKTKQSKAKQICVICSKEYLNFSKNNACSKKCSYKKRYDDFIAGWFSGTKNAGDWRGVRRHVKNWLIEQRGEKCWKCGWCERHDITKRIPIQVDHIDGNPENHRPENLRLLCPNCHSLTPTYGALNKGKGRKQRYARVVHQVEHHFGKVENGVQVPT